MKKIRVMKTQTQSQITTWFTGFPKTFATGYDAVLRFTDKAARHLAIDTNPKAARTAQRKFAGFVNRLLRLLAREYPQAEIKIAGECMSPEMRRAISARHFRTVFGVLLGWQMKQAEQAA
jgi:hypothetical protein